jgi:hypothetical protein
LGGEGGVCGTAVVVVVVVVDVGIRKGWGGEERDWVN